MTISSPPYLANRWLSNLEVVNTTRAPVRLLIWRHHLFVVSKLASLSVKVTNWSVPHCPAYVQVCAPPISEQHGSLSVYMRHHYTHLACTPHHVPWLINSAMIKRPCNGNQWCMVLEQCVASECQHHRSIIPNVNV